MSLLKHLVEATLLPHIYEKKQTKQRQHTADDATSCVVLDNVLETLLIAYRIKKSIKRDITFDKVNSLQHN